LRYVESDLAWNFVLSFAMGNGGDAFAAAK
jgi:hypothetical protein